MEIKSGWNNCKGDKKEKEGKKRKEEKKAISNEQNTWINNCKLKEYRTIYQSSYNIFTKEKRRNKKCIHIYINKKKKKKSFSCRPRKSSRVRTLTSTSSTFFSLFGLLTKQSSLCSRMQNDIAGKGKGEKDDAIYLRVGWLVYAERLE